MEFSLAKWSFVFTKWTHKIKIYKLQLHFSIKQLIRIETRKGNATVLQKNAADSKVFGYKIEFPLTKWSFFAMKCAQKIRSLFLS